MILDIIFVVQFLSVINVFDFLLENPHKEAYHLADIIRFYKQRINAERLSGKFLLGKHLKMPGILF